MTFSKFNLRLIEREDLPFITEVRSDKETKKHLGTFVMLSKEKQDKWFDSVTTDQTKMYLILEGAVQSTDKPQYTKIGYVRIVDIDYLNNSICVGGDIAYEYRGKGYGKHMYDSIFDLCFNKLNMNRVWLKVLDSNERAQKLYTKMGFIKEGVEREAVYRDNKYQDYVVMSILKKDYYKGKQPMPGIKILILCAYYERPNMVRTALESIKAQKYKNWEICFIDDGSTKKGRPIVEEVLRDDLDKVTVIETNETIDDKQRNGGSNFGKYWNQGILNSNADVAIMLCDDDALHQDYLSNLNTWFTTNTDKNWCYSHVVWFNPFEESDFVNINRSKPWPPVIPFLNITEDNICPDGRIDASQVAWRTNCNKEKSIWFPFPQTRNHDAHLYRHMFNGYGGCNYSGFVGEYKAIDFTNNMTFRSTDYTGVNDLPEPAKPIF